VVKLSVKDIANPHKFMVRSLYDFVSKHCWRIFVESSQEEEDKETKGDDEETKETKSDSVVYACYIKCS